MTTYAEIAARNAETIADAQPAFDRHGFAMMSSDEWQALKTAALVFQAQYAGCQMEIRDDLS